MSKTNLLSELLTDSWSERRKGNYDSARKLVDRAKKICDPDDYKTLGRIYHIYMQFESDQGRYENATGYSEQSIAYYKKVGDNSRIAHSIRHLADLKRRLGNHESSEQNYKEALSLYRGEPSVNIGNLANALRGYGILLVQMGKSEMAMEVWEETRGLYERLGLVEGVKEAEGFINSIKDNGS